MQVLNRGSLLLKKIFYDPILLILVLSSLFFVLFFIGLPLLNIVLESLSSKESDKLISFTNYANVFAQSGNLKTILDTILLGLTTASISVLIGFFFAYCISYMKIRVRRIFDFIAILPIISPPFVISLSMILLFGRVGLISRGLFGILDANIYGFHGLVIVQVLSFFPIAYLVLNSLLQRIDPSVEEAARDLGASRWQIFTTVTLPLMIPGLANAFLLIFIQSIADFSNPVIIGGSFTTIAVRIYQEGIGNYQFGLATAMSLILLTISMSMFVVQRYIINKKSYVTVTGKVSRARMLLDNKIVTLPCTIIMLMIAIFILMLYILIPLGSFVKLWGINYTPTLDHYRYIVNLGIKPIYDTTMLALFATPVTGIFAMVLAFLIVRKKFIGKNFIEFVVIMALAIPGTIIGLGYVISYNRSYGFIPPLTGTAAIIAIAFIIRSLPMGVRSGIASLNQIDPSIEEAASVLGASTAKVFTSVTLPMIKGAFFSGLVYTFARSMTLVSTVIFLISAKYNLLTPAIMNQIDQGKIGVASVYCSILIVIVSIVMYILKLFAGKLSEE